MGVLKKIAIGVAIVAVIGLGIVAWFWHQATALPDWYVQEDGQQSPLQPNDPEDPPRWVAVDPEGKPLKEYEPIPLEVQDAPEADAKAPPAPKATKGRAKGKRHEIRGFHRRAVPGEDGKQVQAVKASRATYEDGELELGMIVDLSRFPKDKLNDADRRRLDKAVKNFPALTKRDVWVGVEDHPLNVDGYLQLGPHAQVRVGKLRYSLASAATKVGMTPAQLRTELNRELRRLGLVDPDAD